MRRECGECTLCCTVVPVKEINKPANTKCEHQTFKGCRIYGPGMPLGCHFWNCRWLVNDDMGDQRRPDRSHIVVDILPDFITHRDHVTGVETTVPVIQVWVDPKHPDAWRDAEFRAYMLRRAGEDNGYAFLVRNGNDSAIAVFPPTYFNPPAERWIEIDSNLRSERQHTMDEIAKALGAHQ